MSEPTGVRGRGMRCGVPAAVLALGLALAATAAADAPAPHWIAADAAVYLEVPRPALLIDTALRPQVQGTLPGRTAARSRGISRGNVVPDAPDGGLLTLWPSSSGTTSEDAAPEADGRGGMTLRHRGRAGVGSPPS